MNRYIPFTDKDIKKMCDTIGVSSPKELLKKAVGESFVESDVKLPLPLDEIGIKRYFEQLESQTPKLKGFLSFAGQGYYNHYIPHAVWKFLSRPEFVTAYTPYQPEISQGILQLLFEYQTMMAELFSMDISNASMYDCATALAEAVLMAFRVYKKRCGLIFLSKGLLPQYKQVMMTYIQNLEIDVKEIDLDPESGQTTLPQYSGDENAIFILQNPNRFGVIEDYSQFSEFISRDNIFSIAVVPEPVSLGILRPPGEFDFDVVVAEGQPLGNFPYFGGPGFGIFCTKEKYVRSMPGRLVGQTIDDEGKRGFVLTLSTREQHIRRAKATSNICTNQTLCALAGGLYLSILGPEGLKEVATRSHLLAKELRSSLMRIEAIEPGFDGPFFNEFTVRIKTGAEQFYKKMIDRGIIPGVIDKDHTDLLTIAVTENFNNEDIVRFVEEAKRCL